MNNFKVMNLLLLTSFILNASEIVTMNDKNISKSRKDDAFHFALELGAKGNIWNPGLSKTLLDYDTEGLKLGYATLKLKLYDTDVFTYERFDTLNSSDNQQALLEEYKKDRKKSSSIDGYRVSLHFMKIFNKLTGNKKFDGLTFNYTTRNFIGKASLREDAKYWYGNLPKGDEGKDYTSYSKGDFLSFKTKFEEFQIVNNWYVNDENQSGSLYAGYFNTKWQRPTSFSNYKTIDNTSIAFPAKYENQGLIIGAKSMPKKTDMGWDLYIKFGMDYNVKLAKDSDLESLGLVKGSDKLNMNTVGIKLFYKFSDIYVNKNMNVDFIIGGDFTREMIYKEQETFLGWGDKYKDIDKEKIYGINAKLEFTF